MCCALSVFGIVVAAGTNAPVDPPDEVTLSFVAVMGEQGGYTRLIGVKPSAASLELIELHPGDIVKFEVSRATVVSEKWSQKFNWEVERSEGKDTIKEDTTQASWTTTKLKWGVAISPRFTLGNAEIDLSKRGLQEVQTQQPFKGAAAEIGPSGVQPAQQPAIARPPAAPANAKPAAAATLETLDSNGSLVVNDGDIPGCTLTIRIIRASAKD